MLEPLSEVDAWAPAAFSFSLGQSGGGTICISHGSPSVRVRFDGLQKMFAIAQLSPRSSLKRCPPGLSQSSAPAPGWLSPPPALTADPAAPTVRGPRGASPAERSWVEAPAADSGLFPAGLLRVAGCSLWVPGLVVWRVNVYPFWAPLTCCQSGGSTSRLWLRGLQLSVLRPLHAGPLVLTSL